MSPLWPDRVQRPLLHAGNPDGPEPPRNGGEKGAKVQLQEEKREAGETFQHQGGVTCQVHPGDGGQTRDPEPSVGRALFVVSAEDVLVPDDCWGQGTLLLIFLLFFPCSEIDDVNNDLLHLDIW